MAEAILSLFPKNVWTRQETRQLNKKIHGILQALGASSAIAGVLIMFNSKWQSSVGHFDSTHAKLGAAAFILTSFSLFNGLATFYSKKLKTFVRPKYSKVTHNFVGIAAFALGNKFVLRIKKTFEILFLLE